MKASRLRLTAIAGVVAGAAVLAGCSSTVPGSDPVYTRIDQLQHQVKKLQQKVNGQGLMNVASSQQQLTQQISDLQGQIQDLQHQFTQMQQHEHAVNQNFNQQLIALGGSGAAAAGAGGFRTGGGNPGANPGVGTGVTGQVPAGATSTQSQGAINESGNGSGGTASTGESDQAAYQAAFAKLRAGNNAAAVAAFKQFVQRYPNSSLVPNALYWTAETHYVNGQYKEAIDDFGQVLSKYPSSPKASDSYLKIGYAQYALGDYKKARITFQNVIKKYPGTTPADLAKQRLQKMGSQGQ